MPFTKHNKSKIFKSHLTILEKGVGKTPKTELSKKKKKNTTKNPTHSVKDMRLFWVTSSKLKKYELKQMNVK